MRCPIRGGPGTAKLRGDLSKPMHMSRRPQAQPGDPGTPTRLQGLWPGSWSDRARTVEPSFRGWAVSVRVQEAFGGAVGSLQTLHLFGVAGPQPPPPPFKLIDLTSFIAVFPLQRI